MKSYGDRFRWIRKEFNLTQSDFSDKLKISRSHVANIEINKKEPSDIIISAVCNEFCVNEVWLRTGEGEPFVNLNALLFTKYGVNPFLNKLFEEGIADPAIKAMLVSGKGADNENAALSVQEQKMIDLYRSLDSKAQSVVLEFINSVVRLSKE